MPRRLNLELLNVMTENKVGGNNQFLLNYYVWRLSHDIFVSFEMVLSGQRNENFFIIFADRLCSCFITHKTQTRTGPNVLNSGINSCIANWLPSTNYKSPHISFNQQVNHKSFSAFQMKHWINFLQMDWTVKGEWAVCTVY